MILAELSYETSDPTVDSQIVTLQGSGANVFFNIAGPKFAAQAIRKIREGAVSLDGQKVTDAAREYSLEKPTVLKLGRKFARLKPG
jgi:hypothetical protein